MNFDPVETVVEQTVRTFGLREWQYDIEDIVEDVAAALKLIGAAKVFENVYAKITINSMMGRIPLGCQNIKHLDPINTPYKEDGSFIVIDVPDGTVVNLVYQGIPLDTRGYPVIPDNEPVRQALMWYIVKILILQGEITRVSLDYADQEWHWRCGSARADLNIMSLGDWNKVSNDYRRLNPIKDQHIKNYEEIGKPNTLDREKTRLGRYRDLDDGISSEQIIDS